MTLVRIILSLCLGTGSVLSQTHGVKIGDIVHNILFPPNELLGGLERVIDDVSSLDDRHLSCGKRQVCEAMSLGSAIERSDGSFEFEKGFLRHAVDAAGEAVFEVTKPFLEVFGMGRVARREMSMTQFLVDMVDSVIIEFTRVLAGRRLSRQLEEISPVGTLIEPVSAVLGLIPKSYYGNVLDLAVDITGIANRKSGGYGLMRSAGLGYFYGGGDDSVCKNLQSNLLADDSFCDNDGAFFPLAMLNPINQNELGKTIRLGGEGSINPLMDRTRNPNAMQHVSFEMSDLMDPTKMLCKVDNVLRAYSGHIDVHDDPELEPAFISDEDLMLQGQYEELVEVRRNDQKITMKDLPLEEQLFIEKMMVYERMKNAPKDGMIPIKRKQTSQDKFMDRCHEINKKEIEKILKSVNITVITNQTDDESYEDGNYDYTDEEASGDYEEVVEVRNQDEMDIETVAKIGDRSLLAEKLEVEEGNEMETVQDLVNTFKISANGRIEKVLSIQNKHDNTVLLVQFDSENYRNAVLKASRLPGARSSSRVKLRRPKVKDLKTLVSAVRRH